MVRLRTSRKAPRSSPKSRSAGAAAKPVRLVAEDGPLEEHALKPGEDHVPLTQEQVSQNLGHGPLALPGRARQPSWRQAVCKALHPVRRTTERLQQFMVGHRQAQLEGITRAKPPWAPTPRGPGRRSVPGGDAGASRPSPRG